MSHDGSLNPRHIALALGCLVLGGCAAVRGERPPTTNVDLGVANQYWFRGVPQSNGLVAQPGVTIQVPFEKGDTLTLAGWANAQLADSSRKAAFGNGQAGQFSEIDLTATYTTTLDEVNLFAGAINYSFPNGIGLSTSELFAGVTFASENPSLAHTATLYYDIDEADDGYLTYGLAHQRTLDERFSVLWSGQVGLMGERQAELYFGRPHTGMSDLSATGQLTYTYDEFTSVWARATVLTVPDPVLRDASDDRGFKSSTVVLAIGVGWSL